MRFNLRDDGALRILLTGGRGLLLLKGVMRSAVGGARDHFSLRRRCFTRRRRLRAEPT